MTSKERKLKSVAQARKENIQGKFKVYNVLKILFSYMAGRSKIEILNRHGLCFGAVAVITQLKIEHGETCYDINYDVQYS